MSVPAICLRAIALAFIALWLGCAATAQAPDEASENNEITDVQSRNDLDTIEAALQEIDARIEEIASSYDAEADAEVLNQSILEVSNLRTRIADLQRRATTIRNESREALDAVAELAEPESTPDVSTPAPGESSEEDAGDDETLREQLSSGVLADVTAPYRDINRRASVALAEARLADIDARRLSSQITRVRDTKFVSSVLDDGPSLLSGATWVQGFQDIDDVSRELLREAAEWRDARTASGTPFPFAILGVTSLIALIGLMQVYRRFYKWEVARISERRPTRQMVAQVAMTSLLIRFSAALVAVLLVAGVAYLLGMNAFESELGQAIGVFAVAVLCMRALVSSVLAPRTTSFRLIGVGDQAASAMSLSFVILVFAFTLESVIASTGALASPSPELTSVRTFLLATLSAGLLIWMSVRLKAQSEQGRSWVRMVFRGVMLALALFIFLSALFGYHALSRYTIERTLLFSLVLLIAILVREFVRATALKMLSGAVERRRYATARDDSEPRDEDQELNSEYWIKLGVDAVIVMLLPAFLLLALGMPAAELWNDIRWLLAGFEVGGQRISLGNLLGAILTVISIMVATRIIQRALEKSILPKTQISGGAANSLVTLLGYAGTLFAILSAIGVIGFDLSSLAIIAGALSVGIGFGLQSIVSNFVAGLILLFERPFKIGDWIVTPSGEGSVKKINVRATEIETFDRRSVIVPNAELVSNAFGNWTHKNTVMRISIPVGVKYGTDTRKVEKALLEVADGMKYVRKDPPAYVIMKDFGDSSLDFELRAYIVADHIVIAPSELRHEIAKVFEREEITIPFPQRDLNFEWPKSLTDGTRERSGEDESDTPQSREEDERLRRSHEQATRDLSGAETGDMPEKDGDGEA